jgi:hypothetical protein
MGRTRKPGCRVRRKPARTRRTRRLRRTALRKPRRTRRRRQRGGVSGKEMLEWFDTQHPAGTEIVKGIKPQDLMAIIRCHPDLWRRRDQLLKFYLRVVNPEMGVAFDLPPDLSQIVCKRIDPVRMRSQIELMLLAAIQYNRVDIVTMLVRVFGLTEADLRRADPHLLHTGEMATGSMLRHLAKPAAEGGLGVNVDELDLETALKGAIESGDNEKNRVHPVADAQQGPRRSG